MVGVIRKIKMVRNCLDASVLFFSTSRRCSRKRYAIFSLFRLCRFSYIACRLCNRCTFVEMHVKWSVTLADRSGPAILTVLEIKRQVLHRMRLHVKVPGWFSDLNTLLAK